MTFRVLLAGESRSFPDGLAQLPEGHSGVIAIGAESGRAYRRAVAFAPAGFAAIELGTECLSDHIGLDEDPIHSRTLGFARFRLGNAEPSQLVELVKQPWTDPEAITAARAFFAALGLKTAVCEDLPGRIVDRLIRPYLNAVLRRLDDKLATPADMDATLMMGLGYPEGPIALLRRSGLHHHHDVTLDLHAALGDPDFAPARAAQVAKRRHETTE